MIISLIIWLCKKYAFPVWKKHRFSRVIFRDFLKKSNLVLMLCLSFTSSYAQVCSRIYRISHNGNQIGELTLHQQTIANDVYLKITSKVQTKLLFKVDVHTEDQAHFKKGLLQSSSVSRTVNAKEKDFKQTSLVGNVYQTQLGKKFGQVNEQITYNTMMLYLQEHLAIARVYSDNFQQFLDIKTMADHQYRIKLPDGNYNDYYFENGICHLIVIHHTFYIIKIELA